MFACTWPTGVLLPPTPSTLMPTWPLNVPALVSAAEAAPASVHRAVATANRTKRFMGSLSFGGAATICSTAPLVHAPPLERGVYKEVTIDLAADALSGFPGLRLPRTAA